MPEIIVSLTSYPKRIHHVYKTIMSLLNQTKVPDRIILWLSEEENPNKEDGLPEELLLLKPYGMEIKWCRNLRSHKKYLYAMQQFPNDIIITADDDIIYSPGLIERLYQSYIKYPDCVSCVMAHEITLNGNEILPYNSWKRERSLYDIPSDKLVACGGAGALYPPHCLPKETFSECDIIEMALNQDDLWLKGMELLADIKVVMTGWDIPRITVEDSLQDGGLYRSVNRDGGNDVCLNKLIKHLDRLSGTENYLLNKVIKDSRPENRLTEILSEEGESDIVIYGAGEGASLIYEYLNIISKGRIVPRYFIVSENGEKKKKEEIDVLSISEYAQKYQKDDIVIVAVAEDKQFGIKEILKTYGIENALFISDNVFFCMRKVNACIDDMFEYFRPDCLNNEE